METTVKNLQLTFRRTLPNSDGSQSRTQILLNGIDVTRAIAGFNIVAEVGKPTELHLLCPTKAPLEIILDDQIEGHITVTNRDPEGFVPIAILRDFAETVKLNTDQDSDAMEIAVRILEKLGPRPEKRVPENPYPLTIPRGPERLAYIPANEYEPDLSSINTSDPLNVDDH